MEYWVRNFPSTVNLQLVQHQSFGFCMLFESILLFLPIARRTVFSKLEKVLRNYFASDALAHRFIK